MAHEAPYNVDEIEMGLPPLIMGVLGLFCAGGFAAKVLLSPRGDEKMNEIADAIETGAYSFIKTEYAYLTGFALLLNILVMAAISPYTGIVFLVGCASSAFCGFIGMAISTKANVRTAQAAKDPRNGLNNALRVSFSSGAVMGLTVVSTALICLAVLFMIFGTEDAFSSHGYMAGFSMGAATVSLFSRVGGGIYTKAADVGGDLVGKVEKGIPEDDARNPATIADNVGDNVGDVCGMGADIFGSFSSSIIATCLLGYAKTIDKDPLGWGTCQLAPVNTLQTCGMLQYLSLPYWISATGIIASVFGLLAVRTTEAKPGESIQEAAKNVLAAVRRGLLLAMLFQLGFMAVIVNALGLNWELYACIVIGLCCGRSIGACTEYFTSYAYLPTQSIAKAGLSGPASVIIQGLSVGMLSTIYPTLAIAGTVLASINLAGFYGLALSATGLLSNLGITLATDAFGPVADNAGGIAEMAQLEESVRTRTDILDALGNTTAAIGKGFAMVSAVITGLGLLSTYTSRVKITAIDVVVRNSNTTLYEPYDGSLGYTMAGLVVGSMIPFAFGAVTMAAVASAAQAVVSETRRQFRENPGIMNRTSKPDYARCVHIVTRFSIFWLVLPAIVSVVPPLVIGIGFGPHALGGMLSSLIVGSFVLGLMMSASGGAWDNAKKFVEGGNITDPKTGNKLGKGTDLHKAVVCGDTVGDPFKDTSGPSLNILVKLATNSSVVLALVWQNRLDFWWAAIIVAGLTLLLTPIYLRFMANKLEAFAEEAGAKGPNSQSQEIQMVEENKV